jgi:hypothetical protein
MSDAEPGRIVSLNAAFAPESERLDAAGCFVDPMAIVGENDVRVTDAVAG